MKSGQVSQDDQSIAQLNTNHKALFGGITAGNLIVHPTVLDAICSMMSTTVHYLLLHTL